jgi:2-phosphosulfolactate phosphatase
MHCDANQREKPMAERQLNVYYLPQFVAETDLADSTVVVVDLLRASTTICHALAAGAREIVPFVEIHDALAAAAKLACAESLLAGERGCQRIEGFDLGNSPAEYRPEVVSGRRVFLSTTNGTRALQHARLARRVIVGAVVNLSAVAASLRQEPRADILCAGTAGHVTRDDILAAGAIVHRLLAEAGPADAWLPSEMAEATRREWAELLTTARATGRSASRQLAVELRNTQGGRNLLAAGLDDDLVDCAQIDRLDVVPELDVAAWRIQAP